MKRQPYRQVVVGEWIRIPKRGHVDACCDCGLVHVMNYRVIDWGGAVETLEMQVVKVDRSAAAAMRRTAAKTRRIVAKRAQAIVARMEKKRDK